MGKKGKGGGKGAKGAKGGWQPVEVPDVPMLPRSAANAFLTVQMRGVVWRVMDFAQRVPAHVTVFELKQMLMARHGASVTEFQLYKEEVHPHNQLVDPAAKLADLEFAVAADDDTRVIYYDFEPRVDDCPLLLRPPHDLKIEAMQAAEAAAAAEKAAKYAALKSSSMATAAS